MEHGQLDEGELKVPVTVPDAASTLEPISYAAIAGTNSQAEPQAANHRLLQPQSRKAIVVQKYGNVRTSARQFLKEHAQAYHVVIFLAMCIAIYTLPWTVAAGIFMVFVVTTLLCAWRWNNHFLEVTGDANGLELTVQDGRLRSSLKLSWKDIKSAEQINEDTLRLSLSKQDFTLAQRMIFGGFFEHLKGQDPVMKVSLPDIESSEQRESLLTLLFEHGNLVRHLKPVAAFAETGQDELLLPYNPHRMAQEKTAQFLKKTEKHWITLLVIVSGAGICVMGLNMAFAMLWLLLILGAMFLRSQRDTPEGLTLNREGLAFRWSDSTSKSIPWDCVSHISAFQSTSAKKFDTMIDVHLNDSIAGKRWLDSLRVIMPFFFSDNGKAVRLRLGGFESAAGRRDLLNSFQRFLPAEKITKDVVDVLNPTDPESYTKLWLESLGNSSERVFEGTLSAGRLLDNGRFEIVETLGAGGQATVYLALDRKSCPPDTPQKVVLKEFILPTHAGADVSARSLEHIQKEIDLIKRIHNESIVEYHGLFIEDHRAYLILEHIDGPTLRQLVEREGPLPEEKVRELTLEMAAILKHLHSMSPPVVHRDFTPENLILGPNGKLKLIDFNVAQELETGATRTIVGKHSYIPPEQFRGKPTPQSDIYALGAGLFFLLTGKEPEPISTSHPQTENENVSAGLDAIVARATATDPKGRFESASALIEAVEGKSSGAKPPEIPGG